ncbi:SET domain-containing protein [Ditylenchus destructor]|uniref:SET domain-containing protein n=1 Tax=Ditylenchus destructor TaxID=166010 RepID=A0AAD4N7M0_9BILA|nr:SET domain-containing protein [Ditylenchus destructor]
MKIMDDLSDGKAVYPIPVINTVDDDDVDPSYQYISKNVDKDIREEHFKGCKCVGKCVRGRCPCIDKSTIELYHDGRVKNAGNYLHGFFTERLYECDAATCKGCAGKCSQRMTPETFNLKVELFKTKDAGWAVRSKQYIECGTFVAEFVGEVLSLKEAGVRQRPEDYSYHVHNRDTRYGHYVDPTRYGNISRFFNHSCFPNLIPLQYFSSHRDKTRASIGFIASRHIMPEDEMTIDYGHEWWENRIEFYKDFYCRCKWVYCSFPAPEQEQLSIEEAEAFGIKIVQENHKRMMEYKTKKLKEEAARKWSKIKKDEPHV